METHEKTEPTTTRRRLLHVAGYALTSIGAAAAGFGASRLHDSLTEINSVPGFAWTRKRGFESQRLSTDDAAWLPGDPEAQTSIPGEWKRVGIIGVSLATLVAGWEERPDARLGMLYTDPGSNWHDGWGQPGQLYGGVEVHEGTRMLAAAVRMGGDPAHFTWALSEPNGSTKVALQLPSKEIGSHSTDTVPSHIPIL